MSKLYKKYVALKIQDSSKFYLFHVGAFYIFIDNDAQIMSSVLKLKLTYLNSFVTKCAFPVSSAEKYFNFFKNSKYKVFLVDDDTLSNTDIASYEKNKIKESILYELSIVDIDNFSISEAFEFLHDLQKRIKNI